MTIKFTCRDYGFECDFVAAGNDVGKIIEEYNTHSTEEHGIEYSKEALMQFIIRKG
jgi:predicted small metal-binding protein